jgi:hypothetical protein
MKKYTFTFDENGLNLILAGLNELPAKMSRDMLNQLLSVKEQIDNRPEEEEKPEPKKPVKKSS